MCPFITCNNPRTRRGIGAVKHPLSTPDRQAPPSEPILVPNLQIGLAIFSYLHYRLEPVPLWRPDAYKITPHSSDVQ